VQKHSKYAASFLGAIAIIKGVTMPQTNQLAQCSGKMRL